MLLPLLCHGPRLLFSCSQVRSRTHLALEALGLVPFLWGGCISVSVRDSDARGHLAEMLKAHLKAVPTYSGTSLAGEGRSGLEATPAEARLG